MARYLYIAAGVVTNVVEHPDAPPSVSSNGEDIVPDLTSAWNVGDTYDITDDLKERRLNAIDPVVLSELMRIANGLTATDAAVSGAPTPPVVDGADPMADYRAYLKTQM